MTEKSLNGDLESVNGNRPKSSRKISGRRQQRESVEATKGQSSHGRHVAQKLVEKISTAAALAAAWTRPAGSSADDSGFASTGRQTGSNIASPDKATSNASSLSTTVKSTSPVDWLEVDRVPVSRVPGAVGIINHHNTCFINAVVQCFSNTPAFVVRALDPRYFNQANGELGKELSRLLRALWTGRYSVDSSRVFHRAVRRLASGWYAGEEQIDAHEFASWMLNRLRDERFGTNDVNGSLRFDNVKQTVR